jgi:hypothetical protein
MRSRRILILLVLIAAAVGAWRFRAELGLPSSDPEKQVQLRVTGVCGAGVLVTAENRNAADVVHMSVGTRMLNAETASMSGDLTRREWDKRVPAHGTATECWVFHGRTRPGEEPAFDFEALSVELEK